MAKIVINIVGLAGSGKSEVSKFLENNLDFFTYKTSDVLRNYAKEHNIELKGRQDYFNCHKLLNKNDPLAIIRPILESKHQRICLDGMRAPAPFIELRKQLNAVLIFLDVPTHIRYERISKDLARSGHRVAQSIKHLEEDEAVDYSDDPYLPNMDRMRDLADYVIDATKPLDTVIDEVKQIIDARS